MTHWVIVTEYIAAAYVLVLLTSMLGERRSTLRFNWMYSVSLAVTLANIITNLATVYCTGRVSRGVLIFVNLLYFALTITMTTCIMIDINMLMFEGRREAKRYRLFNILLCSLWLVGLLVVFVGVRFNWLFRVDADGSYFRGPLVWFPFWFLAVDMTVMLIDFLYERKHVRPAFIRVALLLPPLVICVSALQFVFPETLMSGTLGAIAHTVLFIYGQQQRAGTDHLTALASREMFYMAVNRFAERKALFHVIIISLRDYKSINNRFGQREGDAFLRQIGDWIAGLDTRAVTCRFTGVEFAMIVPEDRDADYEKLFAALRGRFRYPWTHENQTVTLEASFADIAFPEHASSVNEMISYLEYAARLAKMGEHDGVMRVDKQLRNRIGRRNYVIAQLEMALVRENCIQHYQPVYDCKKKRFVGAEVLSRFVDEAGSVIMPGEFIPLAEEAGIVHLHDHMVLEAACKFLNDHRDAGIGWLSVNISGMEYRDPAARAWLYDLLERYDLPKGCLHLEITERVFIEDMEGACEACNALRSHGICISMDDFGIGYSNLFNVTKLPLDCIKIDKSLVDAIAVNGKARNLLGTVARGLQTFGTDLIVEGVETAAQQSIVEDIGIDMVQGYYFAKPMGGEALLALLASGAVEVQSERIENM